MIVVLQFSPLYDSIFGPPLSPPVKYEAKGPAGKFPSWPMAIHVNIELLPPALLPLPCPCCSPALPPPLGHCRAAEGEENPTSTTHATFDQAATTISSPSGFVAARARLCSHTHSNSKTCRKPLDQAEAPVSGCIARSRNLAFPIGGLFPRAASSLKPSLLLPSVVAFAWAGGGTARAVDVRYSPPCVAFDCRVSWGFLSATCLRYYYMAPFFFACVGLEFNIKEFLV